jgi:formylglycine-generating enzyme required for sulfatase activity
VTQGQWKALMGTTPSQQKASGEKDKTYGEVNGLGADHPMYFVSAEDADAFVAKLNSQVSVAGWRWALPTEAQWEYACRAGTESVFSFGDVLNGKQANCNGEYPYGTTTKGTNLQQTCEVGSYAANAWGLCDMHGNVYEWCADSWDGKALLLGGTDPLSAAGSGRVLRGGYWIGFARYCRSANRLRNEPGNRSSSTGFRVLAVPARSK